MECAKHPGTELICPKCFAAQGGKTTAKRYSKRQLAKWGKMGGRGRKKQR